MNLLNDTISKYLNIPYLRGGKSLAGMDCSGFTSTVMGELGYNLARSSSGQWEQVNKLDISKAQPGDLIFLKSTVSNSNKPSHVAIVTSKLEDGKIQVAEAPSSGKFTSYRTWDLTKGYYKDHYLGVGRINKE